MKNYKLKFGVSGWLITSILVVVLGTYFWFKTPQRLCNGACDNVLIVGTAAGYAPFVSVDQNGKYEGFDIDVASALADQLDKKLVLKDLGNMSSLFTALQQGKIDMIIWGLSITEDRLKQVSMVHYEGQMTNSYPLIFWQNIPEGINTIDDLAGQTICVEPNSAQDMVLNRHPMIQKLSVEKVDDALLNIQYGKAVAALVEPAIANKFKNKYPQIKVLDVPLGAEDQVQGVGIAIKPENKALIAQTKSAIESLKAHGVVFNLVQKWGIIT